jgi:hypothetical protein
LPSSAPRPSAHPQRPTPTPGHFKRLPTTPIPRPYDHRKTPQSAISRVIRRDRLGDPRIFAPSGGPSFGYPMPISPMGAATSAGAS